MNNTTNASILIPTYNRPRDLDRCLAKLTEKLPLGTPIIIYDDASPKVNEISKVVNSYQFAQLILGDSNKGQAYGRNQLLYECKTDYAVFMDDDCWFTEIGDLLTHVKNNFTVTANEESIRYDAICSQVFRTLDMHTAYPSGWKRGQIYIPIGMGFVVNVHQLKKIGGFNADFGYRHEETELGMRMWINGLKILYDPSIVVEHCHSSEAREDDRYQFLSARNVFLMYYLNVRFPYGFIVGLTKAVLLFFKTNYDKKNLMRGIINGLMYATTHAKNENIMSLNYLKKWRHIVKNIDESR